MTIQLPTELYSDGNWIGLALCAYFTYPNQHSSTIFDDFDLEIPHYLVCYLKPERVSLESLHHYRATNHEFNKLNHGEVIWLSYIPRSWFSDQLNQCTLIEASFASERVGFRANKCGLRLLYRHDEEEFKQTINHCRIMTSLMVDNQESISENIEAVNERTKKQCNDGQAVRSSKAAGSYTDDHEQESMEGPKNLNSKDKGKRVMK